MFFRSRRLTSAPYIGSIIATAFLLVVGGKAQSEPMKFAHHFNGAMRIDGKSTWISAEGEITAETPEVFEKFLSSTTLWKNQKISIDSPGGSLIAGIKLGEIIRRYNLNVGVGKSVKDGSFSRAEPGSCASACVLAFVGGVERYVNAPSKLGVHQFSIDFKSIYGSRAVSADDLERNLVSSQLTIGLITSHLIKMGIDLGVLTLMTKTSPSEIRWLTDDEMKTFKVTFNAKQFTPWAIEPYKNGLVAFSRSENNAHQLTLFCTNKQLKFRLLATGSPYKNDDLVSFNKVETMQIAGKEIKKKDFDVSKVTDGILVTGNWRSAEPNNQYKAILSLYEVTGAERDVYSLYQFNNQNFDQAVNLVQKNCIN
jgi:hypothetical protein